MNAMSVYKISGIFLVLALFLSFASAVTVSGSSEITMGQCDTTKQLYTICSDTTGTYDISAQGDGSNWISLAPSSVSIDGGNCQTFYAFITPECYATSGNYNSQITISGPENTNMPIKLIVLQSHTFDFNVAPLINSTNPCTESVYNIYAKNTGRFRDEFVVVQSGLPGEWVSNLQGRIILNPQESMNTQFKVKSKCNARPSDYPFTLTMANTMTNSSKSVSITQNIKSFVPFSLSGLFAYNSSYEAKTCVEFDKNIVFTATNLSGSTDEITLTLLDSNYAPLSRKIAYFENSKLSVGTAGSIDVGFIIKKMPAQTIPVIVRAYSKNYDLNMDATMDIVSENCYGVSVEKTSLDTNACFGKVVESFLVKNNGSQEFDANISLFGPNGLIESKGISLDVNSSLIVSFEINAVAIGDSNYIVEVESTFSKTDYNFVYGFENCFDVNLATDDTPACVGAMVDQNIYLVNNGTRDQLFRVSTDANWLSVENDSILVNAGNSMAFTVIGKVPEVYPSSYTVTAESVLGKVSKTVNLMPMDSNACNDFEYVVPNPADINCCVGTIIPLQVNNIGFFDTNVYVALNNPSWMSVSSNSNYFLVKESKTFYLYMSPLEKCDSNYFATLSLVNDFNVTKDVNFLVNVFGQCTVGFNRPSLMISNTANDVNVEGGKQVVIDLNLMNDSNVGFNVNQIQIADINSTMDFNNGTFLPALSTLTTRITIDVNALPADRNVTFIVKTSAGDFIVSQKLNFANQGVSITGLFAAFDIQFIGIFLLFVLIIVILVLVSPPKQVKKGKFKK